MHVNTVIKRALVVLVACATTGWSQALAETQTDANKSSVYVSPFEKESVAIPLQPGWTRANKMQQQNMFLLQFLPPGGDPKDVKEMINVTTYRGLQKRSTAFEFMMTNKKNSLKMLKPENVEWKVISQDNPKDVIFEYIVKHAPKVQDQYEMQRVIQGKEGMHVIIYHLRKTDVSPAEREKMLKYVKSVELKSAPPASQG